MESSAVLRQCYVYNPPLIIAGYLRLVFKLPWPGLILLFSRKKKRFLLQVSTALKNVHVVHLGGLQLISLFYNKILIFIATRGGVSGNPGGTRRRSWRRRKEINWIDEWWMHRRGRLGAFGFIAWLARNLRSIFICTLTLQCVLIAEQWVSTTLELLNLSLYRWLFIECFFSENQPQTHLGRLRNYFVNTHAESYSINNNII